MDKFTVSDRLRTIAQYIPDQARVADIGGDHAYLLLHVAREGRLEKGIVGEIHQGPYQNACRHVEKWGQDIDVRLGDGLSIVEPDEINFLVIAGMGSSLMIQILEQDPDKLTNLTGMVLQPNVGSDRLRLWLQTHGWRLTDETLVAEEGIIYEILYATPGWDPDLYQSDDVSTPLLYEIGPYLWTTKPPLLTQKMKQQLLKKRKMIQQLAAGKTDQAKAKWKIESEKLKDWERVVQCLSKEPN